MLLLWSLSSLKNFISVESHRCFDRFEAVCFIITFTITHVIDNNTFLNKLRFMWHTAIAKVQFLFHSQMPLYQRIFQHCTANLPKGWLQAQHGARLLSTGLVLCLKAASAEDRIRGGRAGGASLPGEGKRGADWW